jgi:hypothetical protein
MDSLESGRGFVPPSRQKLKAMKKPYLPPKLTVYGNLTELTNSSSGGMAMADGGMATGMMKT